MKTGSEYEELEQSIKPFIERLRRDKQTSQNERRKLKKELCREVKSENKGLTLEKGASYSCTSFKPNLAKNSNGLSQSSTTKPKNNCSCPRRAWEERDAITEIFGQRNNSEAKQATMKTTSKFASLRLPEVDDGLCPSRNVQETPKTAVVFRKSEKGKLSGSNQRIFHSKITTKQSKTSLIKDRSESEAQRLHTNKKPDKVENVSNENETISDEDSRKSRYNSDRKYVRILWDIENLEVPRNKSAFSLTTQLCSAVSKEACKAWNLASTDDLSVRVFCYHNPIRGTISKRVRKELAVGCCTLIDVGKDKEGAVDNVIYSEMEHIMDEFEPRSTLVALLSGDMDFVTNIKRLTNAKFRTVSIFPFSNNNTNGLRDLSFQSFSWKSIDWKEIVEKANTISPARPPRRSRNRRTQRAFLRVEDYISDDHELPIPTAGNSVGQRIEVSKSEGDVVAYAKYKESMPNEVFSSRLLSNDQIPEGTVFSQARLENAAGKLYFAKAVSCVQGYSQTQQNENENEKNCSTMDPSSSSSSRTLGDYSLFSISNPSMINISEAVSELQEIVKRELDVLRTRKMEISHQSKNLEQDIKKLVKLENQNS